MASGVKAFVDNSGDLSSILSADVESQLQYCACNPRAEEVQTGTSLGYLDSKSSLVLGHQVPLPHKTI